MAVGTGTALIASAAIGAMANRDKGSSGQTYGQQRQVEGAGQQEIAGGQAASDVLRQLQQFQGVGPGQQDVANAYSANNDLAAMLKQYSQGGYAPTQADFSTAQQQMAPQYEALRQSQIQQQQQFRQTAAQTGRGPMDFAFQNKLGQNFQNQNMMLGAQQSQLASQQPMQRLGFMQDFATLKSGLATQALQNRLAIASLGSSIRDAGANYRLGAAGNSGYQTGQVGSQQGNMIQGAIAGMGTGLQLYNQFGGGGGGSGGASNIGSGASNGSSSALGVNTNFGASSGNSFKPWR